MTTSAASCNRENRTPKTRSISAMLCHTSEAKRKEELPNPLVVLDVTCNGISESNVLKRLKYLILSTSQNQGGFLATIGCPQSNGLQQEALPRRSCGHSSNFLSCTSSWRSIRKTSPFCREWTWREQVVDGTWGQRGKGRIREEGNHTGSWGSNEPSTHLISCHWGHRMPVLAWHFGRVWHFLFVGFFGWVWGVFFDYISFLTKLIPTELVHRQRKQESLKHVTSEDCNANGDNSMPATCGCLKHPRLKNPM